MQDDKIRQLLILAGELRTPEIDKLIEYHSQQLDQLRLLKQIVAIQEETSFVGVWTGPVEKIVEKPIEKQQPENSRPPEPKIAAVEKRQYERDSVDPRSVFPIPGTNAWKIYEVLKEYGESQHGEIARRTGIKVDNLNTSLRVWIKNGLFVKTGRGRYRLANENDRVQEEAIPNTAESSTAEATDGESLNGDAFRVRAYLQRMQPSKPMVISADLNIPLGDVVSILQQHACFQMDEKGWRLKAAKPKEENLHRCLA